jgi:LysR family hydrogen peroxide-inducible transcriptional activator
MEEVEKIKSAAQQKLDPFKGALRLGAIATVAPYIFPHTQKNILKAAPHLKLQMEEGTTKALLQSLLSGALDVVVLSPPVDPYLFSGIDLFHDPFYLAVSANNPLAQKKEVEEADLKALNPILLEDEHCMRAQTLSLCQNFAMSEEKTLKAASIETLKQMVANDAGTTLLPKLARSRHDGICYIPFKNEAFSRSISLVWRAGDEREYVYKIMARHITSGLTD